MRRYAPKFLKKQFSGVLSHDLHREKKSIQAKKVYRILLTCLTIDVTCKEKHLSREEYWNVCPESELKETFMKSFTDPFTDPYFFNQSHLYWHTC